ncbi:PREDICTED: C-type lectin domain family 2 member D11-like [Galeopterus variegatus]|uniref:C-type lectin domain family 2 member D11-like n=1 Tax=Galeopterus variegatus TaxID=482537 RepID=A0ABM0PYS5_GALVR|nr:PREDICTED: C-type lectin domain family 2 member D11-like [Galeopterus variegatus]
MMPSEAALVTLKTDLTCRDGLEEEESGKTRQRKCLEIITHVTLAKVNCCFLIIAVLTTCVIAFSVVLSEKKATIEHHVYAVCPENWIGFGSKCFYFSEDARNWTFSQTFCASLEASLAQFETMEELKFLRRYKGSSDHWIGLSREPLHHTWKWTDSTEYNFSVAIRGVGESAYLNELGVSSASVYTERKWICSKPNSHSYSCQSALSSSSTVICYIQLLLCFFGSA